MLKAGARYTQANRADTECTVDSGDGRTAVGGGSIVNISSQAAFQGHPGVFAYTATKWAIRGMTRSAVADLASARIRVDEVATLVLFLASDAASYITGGEFPITGGFGV